MRSPVFIEDKRIRMEIHHMTIGKYYQVEYMGKKYLCKRVNGKAIDIYEVVKEENKLDSMERYSCPDCGIEILVSDAKGILLICGKCKRYLKSNIQL